MSTRYRKRRPKTFLMMELTPTSTALIFCAFVTHSAPTYLPKHVRRLFMVIELSRFLGFNLCTIKCVYFIIHLDFRVSEAIVDFIGCPAILEHFHQCFSSSVLQISSWHVSVSSEFEPREMHARCWDLVDVILFFFCKSKDVKSLLEYWNEKYIRYVRNTRIKIMKR